MLRTKVIEALHQRDQSYDTRDGMDIALCKLNKEKTKLEYSGAFNPLFLLRDDKINEYEADRMPIGIFDFKNGSKKFKNTVIELKKGDLLYLSTDGFIDQFGGNEGKKLMMSEFKKILINMHEFPVSRQKIYLGDKLKKWKGKYAQIDDILVTGIKI
jgi:serine phosphatase RsbU (regulator of sigma subunit)